MKHYTLIDLFAGIGGIRLGFERTKRVCTVFSSEVDKDAAHWYERNFNERPAGDITRIAPESLPDADIVAGGVPCQSFSLMGKRQGLSDKNGALFYRFADILRAKRPHAFFIENVRNLFRHNKGETFRKILALLRDETGYTVYYHVYNSLEWGVPHIRRRIYIVGFREALPFLFPSSFEHTPETHMRARVRPLLERHVPPAYYVSESAWKRFKREMREGRENGYTGKMLSPDDAARTLCTTPSFKNLLAARKLTKTERNGKGRRYPKNDDGIRYLVPRELARLQDFPETFLVPSSLALAARLFGNSVTVRVVYRIAKEIVRTLDRHT